MLRTTVLFIYLFICINVTKKKCNILKMYDILKHAAIFFLGMDWGVHVCVYSSRKM